MPAIHTPQWTDFLSCSVCYQVFSDTAQRLPITVGCGHTFCQSCLQQLSKTNVCPHDESSLITSQRHSPLELPANVALLLLCHIPGGESGAISPIATLSRGAREMIGAENLAYFEKVNRCLEEMVLLLKPFVESILCTGSGNGNILSKPMQRKLVALIQCQVAEKEGRLRCLRAARSLGERTLCDLLVQHQNPGQLASSLWAAVRARGCQFLGPVMQARVLRLILDALEDGSALSRKVLVLFVVQRLENCGAQVSKTAVGHVVQLLYRASCFKVTKREDESSLMQLKDEFRAHDALRREHDAQVVQIAQEAGLRIGPDQWSQLLYSDQSHRSHMQSIIDKLASPQSFHQAQQELVSVLQRTGDPANLVRLKPHLERLAEIDVLSDHVPLWTQLVEVVNSVKQCVFSLVDFIHHHTTFRPDVPGGAHAIGKYKTSLCRDIIHRGSCPRGKSCTFAHSEQELERYRSRARHQGPSTDPFAHSIQLLRNQEDNLPQHFQPPPGAAASGPLGMNGGTLLSTPSSTSSSSPTSHPSWTQSSHSDSRLTYQTNMTPQSVLNDLRMRKEAVMAELEKNRANPIFPQPRSGLSVSFNDSLLTNMAMTSLKISTDTYGCPPTSSYSTRGTPSGYPINTSLAMPNSSFHNNSNSIGCVQNINSSVRNNVSNVIRPSDGSSYDSQHRFGIGSSQAQTKMSSLYQNQQRHSHMQGYPEVSIYRSTPSDVYDFPQHYSHENTSSVASAGPKQIHPQWVPQESPCDLPEAPQWMDLATGQPGGNQTTSPLNVFGNAPSFVSGEDVSGSDSLVSGLSNSFPGRLPSLGADVGNSSPLTTSGSGHTGVGYWSWTDPSRKDEEVTQFWTSRAQDEEVPFSGSCVSKYGPISKRTRILEDILPVTAFSNQEENPMSTTSMIRPFPSVKQSEMANSNLTQQANLTARLVELNAQISVMERDVRLREELDTLEILERDLAPGVSEMHNYKKNVRDWPNHDEFESSNVPQVAMGKS